MTSFYRELVEFIVGEPEEDQDKRKKPNTPKPGATNSAFEGLTDKHRKLCEEIEQLKHTWTRKIEETGMGPWDYYDICLDPRDYITWNSEKPDEILRGRREYVQKAMDPTKDLKAALEVCRATVDIDHELKTWLWKVEDSLTKFSNIKKTPWKGPL